MYRAPRVPVVLPDTGPRARRRVQPAPRVAAAPAGGAGPVPLRLPIGAGSPPLGAGEGAWGKPRATAREGPRACAGRMTGGAQRRADRFPLKGENLGSAARPEAAKRMAAFHTLSGRVPAAPKPLKRNGKPSQTASGARQCSRSSIWPVARRCLSSFSRVKGSASNIPRGQPDALEDRAELAGAALGVPGGLEFRHVLADLGETDPVAAGVAAGVPDGQRAAREGPRHDLGDLADPVVAGIRADVEALARHRLPVGGQRAEHRLADVLDVHDRPPGRAVRGHADLANGVGEAAEVVQHHVEALPRAGAVGGGVAHEDRGEGLVGQRAPRPSPRGSCTGHRRSAAPASLSSVRISSPPAP